MTPLVMAIGLFTSSCDAFSMIESGRPVAPPHSFAQALRWVPDQT